LGVLDRPIAAVGAGSAVHLLKLSVLPAIPARDRASLSAQPMTLKT
jgi:hypothetical protein